MILQNIKGDLDLLQLDEEKDTHPPTNQNIKLIRTMYI